MPKARMSVRPLDLRPDASPEEAAHARGLNEGMLRKVGRLKQEVEKRRLLGIRMAKKIGLREKRIAELRAKLRDELAFLERLDQWDMLFEDYLKNRPPGLGYVADGDYWKSQIRERIAALKDA